jgi:hypothetical protein
MNCVDSFLFVLLILVELVTVTIYTFRIEYIMVRTGINLSDNCSAAICMEEVPPGRLCISFLLPEKTNLRQSYVIYCSV